ncbi:signal peptidase II [Alteromonas halophila]|uniref:Lipoprotein signal peptidase n=1 Tax=Alteromonas halophila TaxID=516698 RepID=A0A918MYQ8_9ALTE|nr:signal peptidase II [Alteromonas halophila]GGW86147.1 lipoprotein signal peptidase [Alteromonas halophila]
MPDILKRTGLRFLWISLVIIILDQWSKHAVVAAMDLYQSVQVLPSFNLTYVHNYGAAFSFLHGAGGWQRWFFTVIALVVSVMILWWLRQTPRHQVRLPVAFSCILGGAIGNVYDRLVHGYVIDFLDFYIGQWHWPAFNIADCAIFIGAALLIIDMIVRPEEDAKASKPDK